MQGTQPPEQVQAAFDDAVKAGQDKERHKNEGQAYANDIVPKARGYASRLFEEASGYKQRIIAMAEGDASRFKQILTEYQKAPEVTRQRLYLETMQQVYSNTTKVMVDAKGQGNLLYLPLDKLMHAAAGASVANAQDSVQIAAPASSSAVPPAPTASNESPPQNERVPAVERGSDGRSRDGLRSRDRGER
jgi:membrane protease subunit HflK